MCFVSVREKNKTIKAYVNYDVQTYSS